MSNAFTLYKTLSDEQVDELNIKYNTSFYSYINNEKVYLEKEAVDDESIYFELYSNNTDFDIKNDIKYLDITLSINNLTKLYNEFNISAMNAIIGVGIIYKEVDSNIRHSIKLGDLPSNENKVILKKEDILLHELASDTKFNLIFYISTPGDTEYSYLANEVGMILYNNNLFNIIIKGEGSLFPIFYSKGNKEELWNYEVNTYDLNDSFDHNNLKINFNIDHPSFKYIDIEGTEFIPDFYAEVMSSALTLLILDLRNKSGNEVFDFTNYDQKSIYQVLHYFHDKLQFRVNDDYTVLLSSIKKFFTKRYLK